VKAQINKNKKSSGAEAEQSMLFLQCQQQPRVPSPPASAPPFRPRVAAAPLSVRVTGGRRGRQAVVAMASADARLAGIASSIRVIPDFPKPGGLVWFGSPLPLPYPTLLLYSPPAGSPLAWIDGLLDECGVDSIRQLRIRDFGLCVNYAA